MNEIEKPRQSQIAPRDAREAWNCSKVLADAKGMIPDSFLGKPAAVYAAILRGSEVGLAPMQALSSIAIINGRATIWGDALVAIVMRHGHWVDVEITGDGDNAVATATLERGDNGRKITRTFSMRDAAAAGLSGKGVWKTYPKRMLMHRARAWAIRDGAADCLMGLQLREEVEDYNVRDVVDETPKRNHGSMAEALAAKREESEPEQIEHAEQPESVDALPLTDEEKQAIIEEEAASAAMEDWS